MTDDHMAVHPYHEGGGVLNIEANAVEVVHKLLVRQIRGRENVGGRLVAVASAHLVEEAVVTVHKSEV